MLNVNLVQQDATIQDIAQWLGIKFALGVL
jgi:hypothetical protein